MSQTAVEDYEYPSYKCRENINFRRGCSLYNALNRNTTTFKDIMKWQYQIAEFGKYITKHNKGFLYPIHVESVHVDSNNNIVASTLYRPSKNPHRDSILMTANSIIDCNRIMLEYIDMNKKTECEKTKFEMFQILSEIVINSNDIKYQTDIVAGAFYTVGKLSQMIEEGVIDMLYEISRSRYN